MVALIAGIDYVKAIIEAQVGVVGNERKAEIRQGNGRNPLLEVMLEAHPINTHIGKFYGNGREKAHHQLGIVPQADIELRYGQGYQVANSLRKSDAVSQGSIKSTRPCVGASKNGRRIVDAIRQYHIVEAKLSYREATRTLWHTHYIQVYVYIELKAL